MSVETSGSYAGGVFVSGGFTNEVNVIGVSATDATHIRVTDSAAALTANGAGCSQVTSDTVDCVVTTLAASVSAGAGDDSVTISGAIRANLSGGEGADALTGGSLGDELSGGLGSDTVRGGFGNDLLYDAYGTLTADPDDDDLDGGGDSDIVYGGEGSDTLHDSGASGVDAVTYAFAPNSSGLNLTVADGNANDGIDQGAEGDEIQPGFEAVQGSSFNDTIVGGPAPETINGSAGNDTLDGGGGADTLEGNAGEDTLRSRDGVADQKVDCDSASTPAPQRGSDETAFIDAADPEPVFCEHVDRLGGAPTPTPGVLPTPTDSTATPVLPTATPVLPTVGPPALAPLCPTSASLFVRTTAGFGADTRIQVAVPVAGWHVQGQLVSTADGSSLLGVPNVRKSTGPGTFEIPLTLQRAPAAGAAIRVAVTVVAPGCPFVSISDDVVFQPAVGAKKASLAPGAGTAAARLQVAAVRVVDCDISTFEKLPSDERRLLGDQILAGVVRCLPPPPAPPEEPKCEEMFDLVALVRMTGECIKKDPKTGVLESRKKVTINGIDIELAGGSVTFEPDTKILRVNGKNRVQIPVKIGGQPKGAVVLRDTIAPNAAVAADKPGLTIPLSDLTINISTPGGGKLGGFLLDTGASAKLALTAGGGSLDLRIKLAKRFGGAQGGTLVKWDESGIELTDAVLKVPEVNVGKLKLRNGELRYKRRGSDDIWSGKLTVVLPAPSATKAPEAELQAEFTNGSLTAGSLEVRDLNRPFGHPTVFLQRLKGSLAITDTSMTLAGEGGITFGPKVGGKSIASLDLGLGYTFADPGIWAGTGQLKLLTGQSGEGSVKYSTDGRLDFDGRVILPYLVMTIDGRVKGTVALPSTFKLAGQVDVAILGLPKLQADLSANETALTVCGTVNELSIGALIAYDAPNSPQLLQGCGLAEWGKEPEKGSKKATRSASTAATTDLPGGLPKAAFAAVGAGAAPNVVLVGPGGRRLAVGESGPGGVAFANPGDATAYFLVSRPEAGEWRLEVQDGSAPVTATRVARGLEEPKVKATVSADGDRRVLRYDIDGPKGQRVQFVESASGVERVLGTVSGIGKGTIKFAPADGSAGKRDVFAYVEQDGLPRGGAVKVATYRAGATPKPGETGCIPFVRESKITIGAEGTGNCTRLKITRGTSGDQVGISWGKSADAETYRLVLTASGRREVQFLPSTVRSFVVKDIERDDGVKVELAGVNEDGIAGPVTRGSLDALKIKPTTKKALKDDGVLGLAEFAG